MRNVLLISSIVVLLLGSVSHGQESAPPTAAFSLAWLKSVVSIEIHDAQTGKDSSIGTGFLVETPNKHFALITAKHVVYENEGKGRLLQDIAYRINTKDGKSHVVPDQVAAARVNSSWFRSGPYDLACRLIVVQNVSDFAAISYSQFLQKGRIEYGDPLFIIGFPLGLRSDQYAKPIVRRASVARIEEGLFIVDGFVYPGNSGGPVVYAPAFRWTPFLVGEWFVGMVLAYIPYVEPAISSQTKRPRIVFEENSGLAIVLPADSILELLRSPEFVKADEAIR